MSCREIQERLADAGLARLEPSADDRAHAERCAACGGHARFLRQLGDDLDGLSAPPLSAVALASLQRRAQAALRASRGGRGYARDLARAFALALLALPVTAVHAWLVAWGASELLGGLLPAPLLGPVLAWLGVFYFGSLALAVGVLYGSIPLAVAHARRPRLELA